MYPDPNPSIPVIASVKPVQTRALIRSNGFPEAQGSADYSVILSPDENGTPGSIPKDNDQDTFENQIPVTAKCSSAGTFSSTIYVSSKTGELKEDGTPLFDSSSVMVNVTCTGNPKIASARVTTTDAKARVGDYATLQISVSNVGDALLEVSADGSTISVDPGSTGTISAYSFCGAVEKKTVNVELHSNDVSSPIVIVMGTVICYYYEDVIFFSAVIAICADNYPVFESYNIGSNSYSYRVTVTNSALSVNFPFLAIDYPGKSLSNEGFLANLSYLYAKRSYKFFFERVKYYFDVKSENRPWIGANEAVLVA